MLSLNINMQEALQLIRFQIIIYSPPQCSLYVTENREYVRLVNISFSDFVFYCVRIYREYAFCLSWCMDCTVKVTVERSINETSLSLFIILSIWTVISFELRLDVLVGEHPLPHRWKVNAGWLELGLFGRPMRSGQYYSCHSAVKLAMQCSLSICHTLI